MQEELKDAFAHSLEIDLVYRKNRYDECEDKESLLWYKAQVNLLEQIIEEYNDFKKHSGRYKKEDNPFIALMRYFKNQLSK